MTAESIVNHLWQSTCFALLAALLAFTLRGNSAKVRYWVWLSASLKFLVPWSALVDVGGLVPWPHSRVASLITLTLPDKLVQMVEPFSPSPYAVLQTQTQTHWGVAALAILWAAGFFAIATTRCRSWIDIRNMLRVGTPVELPIPVPAVIVRSANEPGVIGFLNPVLMLPARLLERLEPEQLDALLAHEMSHIRRRDNFFAALQMGIEAIFWFHPLVWWIGSRMLEERELACDEEVLRLGCEPTAYVRGILTVCQHYSEAPLSCISGVAGADIKKRLKSILRGKLARDLNWPTKLALVSVSVAAIVGPVSLGVSNAPAARAQSSATTFEVASVKPNKSGSQATLAPGLRNGTLSARNASLKVLIRYAYGVSDLQIVGPSWLDADRFDLAGKAPQGVADNQLMPMLQALLKERFHLAVHHETKVMPAFDMVIGKAGLKISPFDPAHPIAPPAGYRGRMNFGVATMPELATRLTNDAGKVVLDKTGLNGRYSFMLLNYTPVGAEVNGAADATPDLIAAVEEQLGLKLVPKNEPVELLVVDQANRAPTQN